MTPGRTWRRNATERNDQLVPLPDDWSLWDAASGLAIARIHAEPGGGWRCVCRSVDSHELRDSIMGWFKTGKQAKEFAESQTQGQYYVVILTHNPPIFKVSPGLFPRAMAGRLE